MRKHIVTFSEWVQKYANEDDPRGGLARRMRDRAFPALGTYHGMIAFMKVDDYTPGQIAAFKELWKLYYAEHRNDVKRACNARSYMKKRGDDIWGLQIKLARKEGKTPSEAWQSVFPHQKGWWQKSSTEK